MLESSLIIKKVVLSRHLGSSRESDILIVILDSSKHGRMNGAARIVVADSPVCSSNSESNYDELKLFKLCVTHISG